VVPGRTDPTVKRMLVTDFGANVIVRAEPLFGSSETGTLLPSEKVRVPPVTWSVRLGRSKSCTPLIDVGFGNVYSIHAPTPWPLLAHSYVAATGEPWAYPSRALAAACVALAWDDAATVVLAFRATFPVWTLAV